MFADPFILKFAQVIINPVIKLIFILATLVFLWGVLQFIKDAEDPSARTKGKNAILWGIIGITIMVAVSGIIRIAVGTVNTLR